MHNVRRLLISFATVAATVVGASTAHADRKMLVLIDASGSMSTTRGDLQTRFEAAKQRALDQINIQAGLGLNGVAIYTFSDATSTLQTVGGFVPVNTAIKVITGDPAASPPIPPLDLFTVGGGITPLAGSMCKAVNDLLASAATTKILEVASDGEENATPTTDPCFGPFSMDPNPPYTPNSWENLVLSKVQNAPGGIQVQIDLFDPGPITGFAAFAAAMDPEATQTAAMRFATAGAMMSAAAAAGDGPPTLQDFFGEIARVSGGRLTVIEDTATTVPVLGDADGNSCIDRSDAIAVARSFGQTGDPQDLPFDLDNSSKVGFTDYAAEVSRFTPGGCGTPDPYTPRAPIVCRGALSITLNANVIENGGITVDARGACNINIINSLIVAGQNALDIRGSALITVQNSIIVGEGAAIRSNGATMVITKDSVFHGARNITGVFSLVDLGGNTFE
jgi:hypothetical protein